MKMTSWADRHRPRIRWAIQVIIITTGLAIAAVGVLLTANTAWGVSPWDVLHKALGRITGLHFGTMQQIVGFSVLLVTLSLGGRRQIRLGTIFNIVLIGQFVKWFSGLGMFPMRGGWLGLAQLVLGVSCFGFGVAMYISAGLGAGPRDGLLLVLVERTGRPVWLIKILIDVAACAIGTVLRGPLGVGTVIYALLLGPNVDFFLRLLGPFFSRFTGAIIAPGRNVNCRGTSQEGSGSDTKEFRTRHPAASDLSHPGSESHQQGCSLDTSQGATPSQEGSRSR